MITAIRAIKSKMTKHKKILCFVFLRDISRTSHRALSVMPAVRFAFCLAELIVRRLRSSSSITPNATSSVSARVFWAFFSVSPCLRSLSVVPIIRPLWSILVEPMLSEPNKVSRSVRAKSDSRPAKVFLVLG